MERSMVRTTTVSVVPRCRAIWRGDRTSHRKHRVTAPSRHVRPAKAFGVPRSSPEVLVAVHSSRTPRRETTECLIRGRVWLGGVGNEGLVDLGGEVERLVAEGELADQLVPERLCP